MNSWNFTCFLGNDAEAKYTSGGDAIVSFSAAVKSGYGEKESTVWARCSMFGKRGQAVAPYLLKGTQVGIVGELSIREWKDKDGQTRTAVEVRVSDLTLLGKKESGQPQQRSAAPRQAASFADIDSDIPFSRPALIDGIPYRNDGSRG